MSPWHWALCVTAVGRRGPESHRKPNTAARGGKEAGSRAKYGTAPMGGPTAETSGKAGPLWWTQMFVDLCSRAVYSAAPYMPITIPSSRSLHVHHLLYFSALLPPSVHIWFSSDFFFFFSRPSIVLMSPRLSEYEHRTSHNRYANKQIFWLDGYKRLQECPNVIGALHMKQRILAKMCTNYRTTANREWMYSCESIKSQTLQMHLHANSIEFTLRFFVCAVNCLIHCRPSAPHMPGSSARMEPRTGGGQTQASISYCSF